MTTPRLRVVELCDDFGTLRILFDEGVPWAWGANGIASVTATSAAMVLAMTVGYRSVVLAGAVFYAVAAAVTFALPRPFAREGDRRA